MTKRPIDEHNYATQFKETKINFINFLNVFSLQALKSSSISKIQQSPIIKYRKEPETKIH